MFDSALRFNRVGTLQCAALDIFIENPSRALDTLQIARLMLRKSDISERELASTRRVLRILVKRGSLRDMTRHWPDGRRRWSLHDLASNAMDSPASSDGK